MPVLKIVNFLCTSSVRSNRADDRNYNGRLNCVINRVLETHTEDGVMETYTEL